MGRIEAIETRSAGNVLGLFSGAGGLDLGFEIAGFRHLSAMDIAPWCVRTMRHNRPDWHVHEGDVRDYVPHTSEAVDVLLAGFPCQGFSLGGSRDASDTRNQLYKEVVRIAKSLDPKVVVIENVLNLRTMKEPTSGKPFAEVIADAFRAIGYHVMYDAFRVSQFGVPQTRRRFIFLASRHPFPAGFHLPKGGLDTSIRDALYDLAQDGDQKLPNHAPRWGFKSHVHVETAESFDPSEIAVPVRFSRTASDGHPIRSFDAPFPAVDTATVWGWARGNVRAIRVEKDRSTSKFVRNPEADARLWRISASQLRSFTAREYARLQTFPDNWEFLGQNKRDIQLQIGNAVPVRFAEVIGHHVARLLRAQRDQIPFEVQLAKGVQLDLV
jgi:DNA (cytosine-5)-methyltransferase 1